MNKPIYIYTLSDPRTNTPRYVGKTYDMEKRLGGHYEATQRTHTASWVKSLKKIGVKPVIEALEVIFNSTDEEWKEAERFWISYLRFLGFKLTNLDAGGIGSGRASEETKQKLRVWNTGRKMSDEARKNCSLAHIGIRLTEAAKAKLSANHPGKNPEYRAKMSAILTGRKHSKEWCRNISISLNNLSPEVKARMADAVRAAKTPEINAKISAALKGRTLTAEHRRKLSLAKQKQYANGWAMSKEHKESLQKALRDPEMIKRRGESIKRAWDRRKLAKEQSVTE